MQYYSPIGIFLCNNEEEDNANMPKFPLTQWCARKIVTIVMSGYEF